MQRASGCRVRDRCDRLRRMRRSRPIPPSRPPQAARAVAATGAAAAFTLDPIGDGVRSAWFDPAVAIAASYASGVAGTSECFVRADAFGEGVRSAAADTAFATAT